jgi:hypothetical protein
VGFCVFEAASAGAVPDSSSAAITATKLDFTIVFINPPARRIRPVLLNSAGGTECQITLNCKYFAATEA